MKLFEPGMIGKVEIKNRIVMSAMGTRAADGHGYITGRMIDHYVSRAKGGVGLILSEACDAVRESRLPKTTWLFDDCFVPALSELAQAIHREGAKMFIQLVHRGIQPHREAALQSYDRPLQIDICGPSAIPYGPPGLIPRELTRKDIQNIIEQFAEAARRVKDAGFDGVEFHGAHEKLLSCFFSPLTNKRTDEYGGSVKNRTRIACELISQTREKVGSDFPVTFKINGCDFIKGGVEIDEGIQRAQILEKAGVDALTISGSFYGSTEWQFLCYMHPAGAITHLAEAVKKAVGIPIIAVGKIGDPTLAERILQEDKADFVAMGRALLADPELPNKAKDNRYDEIRKCIYCNNCLILHGTTADNGDASTERSGVTGNTWMVRCTVNPELLCEREMELRPAPVHKRVIVVGGGLAGMEAARVLATRGHEVMLYEKGNALGGQWNIASQLDSKQKLYPGVLVRLKKGMETTGVKVYLNSEVDRDLVMQIDPDAVVLATGAKPKKLAIPGLDNKIVINDWDLIVGKANVGDRVVVAGGRNVGMEVADYLARQGKRVSLVTMRDLGQNGRPLESNVFRALRNRLIGSGVAIFTFSTLKEIREDGIYILNSGQPLFLAADSVVLSLGVESENRLAKELDGLVPEIHCIGDCVQPRNALEAISEGAEIGRRI